MRSLCRLAPHVFVAALCFGASAPALADVESGSPKQDMPSDNGDKDEAKSGGCSVSTPKLEYAALAGLVLVISGMSLRRRAVA